MNTVIEFNHGMAKGLMLAIAMLQDDLHDFSKLTDIEDGLPLSVVHAAAYNEIFLAKKKLERAHELLVNGTVCKPYPFVVYEAMINELERWRDTQPCVG